MGGGGAAACGGKGRWPHGDQSLRRCFCSSCVVRLLAAADLVVGGGPTALLWLCWVPSGAAQRPARVLVTPGPSPTLPARSLATSSSG